MDEGRNHRVDVLGGGEGVLKIIEQGRVSGGDCVSCRLLDSNQERAFWKKLLDGMEGDERGALARLE
jgi:hypothetical protein